MQLEWDAAVRCDCVQMNLSALAPLVHEPVVQCLWSAKGQIWGVTVATRDGSAFAEL